MRSSTSGVCIATTLVLLVACGSRLGDVGHSSAAVTSCPWDPGFGTDQCDQGDWWLEFSVTDMTTTSMVVEVQGTTTVIPLTGVMPLGDGNEKFTGGPSDGPVPQGTMIRVTATSGSNQTAQSDWFAYRNDVPAVDCSDASVADAGAPPDATPDVTVVDAGGGEGGGGGGGGGCVPSWSPFWQQTTNAGSWWVEYVVQGGGSLPVSVTLQFVGGASYPLTYCCGKWTSGLNGEASGETAILSAKDATGATVQTLPFQYLVDQSPTTDPCSTTPSTSPSCVPLSRGMLTITMDDSYPSQETLAAPVLAKYGMKATIYNITRQLDLYGDLPNAQALASAGHEVGSHTVNHLDLTTLSLSDLDYELSASQAYLLANVGTPVDSFATPMGSYNATVLTEIRKYYASHRTVNPGLNYMGSSVFELSSDGAYNTVSPSDICAGLQDAAKYHGWRILMFHDFTTDPTSSQDLLYPIADFDSILACAKSTPGLDVVTTHDGANAIRCASP